MASIQLLQLTHFDLTGAALGEHVENSLVARARAAGTTVGFDSAVGYTPIEIGEFSREFPVSSFESSQFHTHRIENGNQLFDLFVRGLCFEIGDRRGYLRLSIIDPLIPFGFASLTAHPAAWCVFRISGHYDRYYNRQEYKPFPDNQK
ncbi:hypothetical protein [Natrinema ejinorense]|uniref:hypothetical protein n=1 Tax=Natrinema ejinorense TaxID=373386 RepID=UPI00117BF2F9|nr:hypothetical protein [Natrinema ejinorense]